MVRRAPSILLAALCGTVLSAAPAAAHDQLTGTEPRADEIVAAVPEAVHLTFSGNPMPIGTTVLVVDAKGDRVGSASPAVKHNVVSLELPKAATDAWYQVRWRVVSADGHLLSGSFDFGVGDPSAVPKPGLAAGSGSDVSGLSVEPAATGSPVPSDGSIPRWSIALLGAALALATLWLADGLLRRRRTTPATEAPAQEGTHHE